MRPLARPAMRSVRSSLEAEVAELRARLGGDGHYTLEQWKAIFTQEQRDQFAARALIASNGDANRAACRLGFEHLRGGDNSELLLEVFATPGVRAILARDLAEPEKCRQEMIQRQVQIVLYGEDANSLRAFQTLAKTCGWVKTPDVLVQHNRQTILALVQGQQRLRQPIESDRDDPLPFLEHEPGTAVRIDSGETVAAAQGEDEE